MRIAVVALLAARAAWAAEPSPPDEGEAAAATPAGADVALPAALPAQAPAAAPSPSPSSPARVGDDGVFVFRSGGTVAGRLVSTGPEGDVVELRSGQRVRLPAGAVVGRLADL